MQLLFEADLPGMAEAMSLASGIEKAEGLPTKIRLLSVAMPVQYKRGQKPETQDMLFERLLGIRQLLSDVKFTFHNGQATCPEFLVEQLFASVSLKFTKPKASHK